MSAHVLLDWVDACKHAIQYHNHATKWPLKLLNFCQTECQWGLDIVIFDNCVSKMTDFETDLFLMAYFKEYKNNKQNV